MSLYSDQELIQLFSKNTPLIDVRAPVEFSEGAIPNSVNLPLMNDEERHLVGICYKEHGQAAAIELGHQLVGGKVKEERIELWRDYIRKNPSTEVFCFRGGLRSQISCEWMDMGKKPIPGGYKRLRNFFLSWINEAPLNNYIRLGGLTGSGKTTVLAKVRDHIDIEKLANHRGSAFGPRGWQPSQISFENLLALDLMKLSGKRIVVEDESAMLGKITIPQRIFQRMRASPLVILEVDPEERLQILFNEYVKDSNVDFFLNNLNRIRKKFGNAKTDALALEIQRAFDSGMLVQYHEGWISTLITEYYDPLYQKDLRYNQDKVIFRGKEKDVLAFLEAH
jgi:tRNA 2-selenouridine synthase